MRTILRTGLAALGFALAPLAFAQASSSSSITTTTTGAAASSVVNVRNGNTHITGSAVSDGSGSAANPDNELLGRVVSALAADPLMDGAMIDVRVEGGRVELNGTTRDNAQALQARSVADGVAGSANVASRLTSAG